jgi:anti-sigma28 factor (negative regulator of flagellin synthesis)
MGTQQSKNKQKQQSIPSSTKESKKAESIKHDKVPLPKNDQFKQQIEEGRS